MRTRTLLLLFVAGLIVGPFIEGCHSQVTPSSHSVVLSWTAPASPACTTTAPCTYVISRAPESGSSCPATSATNYTPLNQSTPVSGTTYTDTTIPSTGGAFCFIAQTLQSGLTSQPSAPSNVVTVAALPGAPGAPSITSESEMQEPMPKPSPQTASLAPTKVLARLGNVREGQ